MSSTIDYADIVVGLAWGDESKGKIVSHLSSNNKYDLVLRWNGGDNAGHTITRNGKRYITHLIPAGVFHGVPSLIGPGCVLHPPSFEKELEYLDSEGFDAFNLVKVHPNCHIVTDEHIEFDKSRLAGKLGTTSRGIAPAYTSKAARTGLRACEVLEPKFLWNGDLCGKILCEGAQGVWLDINHGTYPYVTSSETLPYAACSVGFPPQKIRHIWGAAKAYDTRSGEDPLFPDSLLDVPELLAIADAGKEYGATTGRRRKVRWLDIDRLIKSINMTGTTHLVVSKCDILKEVNIFKLIANYQIRVFQTEEKFISGVRKIIQKTCPLIQEIYFSYSPEEI